MDLLGRKFGSNTISLVDCLAFRSRNQKHRMSWSAPWIQGRSTAFFWTCSTTKTGSSLDINMIYWAELLKRRSREHRHIAASPALQRLRQLAHQILVEA